MDANERAIERAFGSSADNGDVESHKVSLAAGGVVMDEQGHVLLIRENYGKRRYGLPGGRVDAGETPEEAVVREVREETGLEVAPSWLIGTIQNRDWNEPMLILVYRCEVVGGDLAIQDPDEIAELAWFDPADYPEPTTLSGPPAVRAAVAQMRGVQLEHALTARDAPFGSPRCRGTSETWSARSDRVSTSGPSVRERGRGLL